MGIVLGGNCPRWELSWVAIVLGGNCLVTVLHIEILKEIFLWLFSKQIQIKLNVRAEKC